MGLILDTSTLVTRERRGHSVAEILEQAQNALGETEVGLSAVTIVELTHGIQRARLEEQRQRRQVFVQELRAAVMVHPLTDKIAERAGPASEGMQEAGSVVASGRVWQKQPLRVVCK